MSNAGRRSRPVRTPDGFAQTESGQRLSFGALLRAFRVERGLTQDALAERAGLSSQAVSALEQGIRRTPYRDTIHRLSEALCLSEAERSQFNRAAQRSHQRVQPALPEPVTSFIERPDIDRAGAVLTRSRVLAITGQGGIGKTRVAIEVVKRHAQAWEHTLYIDLAEIGDGSEILPLLRIASGIPAGSIAELARSLASQRTLIVFDTCEHVMGPVTSAIDELTQLLPELSILATSRIELELSFAVTYPLAPLALPSERVASLEEAQSFAACALFIDRARASGGGWLFEQNVTDQLVDICRATEGIPLAIELAAARAAVVGLAGVIERPHFTSPASVKRDRPERQKSMHATVAWSYGLLSDGERTLLQRLSSFGAAFDLDDVERRCADETLRRADIPRLFLGLVRASLVTASTVGATKTYRLPLAVDAFCRAIGASGDH